ncbi:monooxygenase FAD-binding protein [Cubamyces sp. BRFM 1775]|nr:monooxygenase FAD-binding protein [Cubamyces sp. BRFM 1775]
MTSTHSPQPRIAIVGGGPSGLVLLLTLYKRGIPATLYERESSSDSRAHLGGMLDLEWDSGQRALRENGLEDEFVKHSRSGDIEEKRLCGKDGVPIFHRKVAKRTDVDLKESRPEIERRALRDLLLGAVPAESVKWGHALCSVRPLEGDQHELTFSNGVVAVADILIGADGAHSRVRPLVSPVTPQYYGVTGAEISIAPDVAARPENRDILEAVGLGALFACEDGKMFGTGQPNVEGRIRAYAWHRAPLDWVLPSDPKEAKKALLEVYDGWAPWLRKFIKICDEQAIYARPLFYLPVGHRWPHKAGVTLLGDAAHLMGPFAGAGANLAMLDGLELGLVLANSTAKGLSVKERETAVAAWEEEMLARAEVFAAMTAQNLEACLSPDAPQSIAARWSKAFSQSEDKQV